MPPMVREPQKMAEYQVNSGNGVELTRDSYHKPRSASPMTTSMPRATSSPPCRTRSPGLPGLRVACRAHARHDGDGVRQRARRRVGAGRRGAWWWEGRSGCRHHSYSVETPRQLLHAARERSEAYLDVVLGALKGNARTSMSTAAGRGRWLGTRSVVVAHADGSRLTAPHVAVSDQHVCRRGRVAAEDTEGVDSRSVG